jgi:FMN phosphatase YigB (HAD superfamily)
MFNLFKREKDPELVEVEHKLDKDFLEQMLYEFKDATFYQNHDMQNQLSSVDLSSGELLYIDDVYDIFFHAEETIDQFLINEYRPSKEVLEWLKDLRTASLYAQATLFKLTRKKGRIQQLLKDIDFEVYLIVATFRSVFTRIFHEIFESYDIRVYPTFRQKIKDTMLALENK